VRCIISVLCCCSFFSAAWLYLSHRRVELVQHFRSSVDLVTLSVCVVVSRSFVSCILLTYSLVWYAVFYDEHALSPWWWPSDMLLPIAISALSGDCSDSSYVFNSNSNECAVWLGFWDIDDINFFFRLILTSGLDFQPGVFYWCSIATVFLKCVIVGQGAWHRQIQV